MSFVKPRQVNISDVTIYNPIRFRMASSNRYAPEIAPRNPPPMMYGGMSNGPSPFLALEAPFFRLVLAAAAVALTTFSDVKKLKIVDAVSSGCSRCGTWPHSSTHFNSALGSSSTNCSDEKSRF